MLDGKPITVLGAPVRPCAERTSTILFSLYNPFRLYSTIFINRKDRTERLLLSVLLVVMNKTCRRTIMPFDILWLVELRKDILRQNLPELDAHLIEGINTPNNPLCKYFMLVQNNQRPQRRRRQLREQYRVRWAVPFKHLALDQGLARPGSELLADLVLGLSERERLGLREEVGEEDAVMLGVGNGVVCGGRRQEVGGDELGSLVQELIEGVLAVGAGCAPDDGARLVVDALATFGDGFTVGFHVSLLEVIGEFM